MLRIPLTAVPSQSFTITLGGQRCKISVTQRSTGVFLDLAVNGQTLVACAVCLDRVKIVRFAYLGFAGDLAFIDTQGKTDPYYTGFADRYKLVYLDAK